MDMKYTGPLSEWKEFEKLVWTDWHVFPWNKRVFRHQLMESYPHGIWTKKGCEVRYGNGPTGTVRTTFGQVLTCVFAFFATSRYRDEGVESAATCYTGVLNFCPIELISTQRTTPLLTTYLLKLPAPRKNCLLSPVAVGKLKAPWMSQLAQYHGQKSKGRWINILYLRVPVSEMKLTRTNIQPSQPSTWKT